NQPAARKYFYHEDGTPIEAGFVRDNPAYAKSLQAIAQDYRAFYEGPLAQAIVDAVHEEPRPGLLSMADMKAYEPQKSEALCSPYRDYILCGAQPPSSGGVAVQSIMGQLANFDMKALGPTLKGWHVFAEASELAYADRDLYVADPDFVDVPTRALIDPAYLKSRAALIKMDSALKDVKAGDPVHFKPGQDATPDKKGTSHFSIVDKWGNVVSMTTTVESLFGSERMAGGFMLNNQLTDFSFVPRDKDGKLVANRPQPGKRPRSSMAPHIVFHKDGNFAFTTGSPGGSSIIAYTAKTMIAMIDWGMDPQQAVELANFISRNGSIRLEEAGLDTEIISGLEAMGHKVVRSKGEISGLHIVRRKADGSYDGGADPRREGQAKSE
ncbi:MAG TPA: gamma-glutamyltransferase, partial [Hellea balneolensis]|nr:gamma-glutamyltransferase [Hellea balneolensis]